MGAKNAKQATLIESQNTRNLSAEEKDLVTDALLIQSAFALNKNTTEQFLRIKNRFRSQNAQPESQEKTVVAEQPIQPVEEKTEESVKDSRLKEVNDTYTDDQIYTDPDLEGVDASASPEGKEKTLTDVMKEINQQIEKLKKEKNKPNKEKDELTPQEQQEPTPVILPPEPEKTGANAEAEEEISDTPEQPEPQVPVEPAKEEIKEHEKSSKKWLGMIGLVGLLGLGGLFGLKSDKNQQSDKGDLDRETLNQPKMVQQEKVNKQSVITIERKVEVIQTIGSTQIWGMAPSGNQVTPENKTQFNDSTNNQASVVSAVKDAANGSIDVVKKAANRTIDAGEDLLHGRIASSVRNLTDIPTGAVQDVTNVAFDAVENTGDIAQKAQSELKIY